MSAWQVADDVTPRCFAEASGAVEFTVDAGKVNTCEEGWKELKIGAFQKRPAAACATPHGLADRAGWIWKAVDRVFTGSQQTLDIYHACRQLAQAGEKLYGEGSSEAADFLERGRNLLLHSGWRGVTEVMGEELQKEDTAARRAALEKLVGYFAKHVGRIGYRERLAAGQAIGSGAIEGWAKTLGLRLKARGARWKKVNVRRIATLGCVRNSSQWSNYWSN